MKNAHRGKRAVHRESLFTEMVAITAAVLVIMGAVLPAQAYVWRGAWDWLWKAPKT